MSGEPSEMDASQDKVFELDFSNSDKVTPSEPEPAKVQRMTALIIGKEIHVTDMGFRGSKGSIDHKLHSNFTTAEKQATGVSRIIESTVRRRIAKYDGFLDYPGLHDYTTERMYMIIRILQYVYIPRFSRPGEKVETVTIKDDYDGKQYRLAKASWAHTLYQKIAGLTTPVDPDTQWSEMTDLLACFASCRAEEDPLVLDAAVRSEVSDYYEVREEMEITKGREAQSVQLFRRPRDVVANLTAWVLSITGYRYEPNMYTDDHSELVIAPIIVAPNEMAVLDLALYRETYVSQGIAGAMFSRCQTETVLGLSFLNNYEKSFTQGSTAIKLSTGLAGPPSSANTVLQFLTKGLWFDLWTLITCFPVCGLGCQIDILGDDVDPDSRYSAFLVLSVFLAHECIVGYHALVLQTKEFFAAMPNAFVASMNRLLAMPSFTSVKPTVVGGVGTSKHKYDHDVLHGADIAAFPALSEFMVMCSHAALSTRGEVGKRGVYLREVFSHTNVSVILSIVRHCAKYSKLLAYNVDLLSPVTMYDRDGNALFNFVKESRISISCASILRSIAMVKVDHDDAARDRQVAYTMELERTRIHYLFGQISPILDTCVQLKFLNYLFATYQRCYTFALRELSTLVDSEILTDKAMAHAIAKRTLEHAFHVPQALYDLFTADSIETKSLLTERFPAATLEAWGNILETPMDRHEPAMSRVFLTCPPSDPENNIMVREQELLAELGMCTGYVVSSGADLVLEHHAMSNTYFISYKNDAATVARSSWLTSRLLQGVASDILHPFVEGLASEGPVYIRTTGKVSLARKNVEGPISGLVAGIVDGLSLTGKGAFQQLTKSGLAPYKVGDLVITLLSSMTLSAEILATHLFRLMKTRYFILPKKEQVSLMLDVEAASILKTKYSPERNRQMFDTQGANIRNNPEFFVKRLQKLDHVIVDKIDMAKYFSGYDAMSKHSLGECLKDYSHTTLKLTKDTYPTPAPHMSDPVM